MKRKKQYKQYGSVKLKDGSELQGIRPANYTDCKSPAGMVVARHVWDTGYQVLIVPESKFTASLS